MAAPINLRSLGSPSEHGLGESQQFAVIQILGPIIRVATKAAGGAACIGWLCHGLSLESNMNMMMIPALRSATLGACSAAPWQQKLPALQLLKTSYVLCSTVALSRQEVSENSRGLAEEGNAEKCSIGEHYIIARAISKCHCLLYVQLYVHYVQLYV